jgi:hypothetical protein
MERIKSADLLRWLVGAVFLATLISVAPEYWAAERLPLELELLRGAGTVALLVLTAMLMRARHESAVRRFPLAASIATVMLLEAALKVGPSARVVAMLVAWAVVVWIEWRRLVDEERRFA